MHDWKRSKYEELRDGRSYFVGDDHNYLLETFHSLRGDLFFANNYNCVKKILKSTNSFVLRVSS